jgi:hypothetical protein
MERSKFRAASAMVSPAWARGGRLRDALDWRVEFLMYECSRLFVCSVAVHNPLVRQDRVRENALDRT